MTAADWVFRHAGGCLIEVPPLGLPSPPPGTVLRAWVATLWRDATRPGGWARLGWVVADRGWELPRHLAVGDVVEFGLAAVDLADAAPPGWDLRWYGWLRYCTGLAAVVAGPYPDAPSAAAAAAATVDEVRLGQLTAPGVAADLREGVDNPVERGL